MVTGDQIESKTFDVKNHVKKNETGEVNKKVKSLGAHYKDTEKSVISIVKYLDETLETLDVKKKINLEKRHFVQMAQQKTIVDDEKERLPLRIFV